MAPCFLASPLKCLEKLDAIAMPKNNVSSLITSTIIDTLRMPACPLMISTFFFDLEWPKKLSRPHALMTSLNKPENTKSLPSIKASSSLKSSNFLKNLPIKEKLSSSLHLTVPFREKPLEISLIFYQLLKKSPNCLLFASIVPKKQPSHWEQSTHRKSSWLEAKSHTSQCAESVISHNSN